MPKSEEDFLLKRREICDNRMQVKNIKGRRTMSVRFSTEDSANLIATLHNNVAVAEQIIHRLSSGSEHLIRSLDAG